MKTAFEERVEQDVKEAIESAKRMMISYEADGHVQSLYNARNQLTQAATSISELVGYKQGKVEPL